MIFNFFKKQDPSSLNLAQYQLAILRVDKQKNILYTNDAMKELLKKDFFRKEIASLSLEKDHQLIRLENKDVHIFVQQEAKEYLLTAVLLPESKYKQREYLAALLFVDNYDETLESMREENKPLLIAVIDRKLYEITKKLEGIIRKFEKDKYLLLFDKEKLYMLEENKFEVFKKMKEIDFGNKIPVTVSMGIGISSVSYLEAMDFSRQAIDLALSRGGDQSLIKEGENYRFFGGNSDEIIKNSSVRARIKAYGLEEIMNMSETIYVMGHRNPDLDSIGASMGIYRIAKTLGKECFIVMEKPSEAIMHYYRLIQKDKTYEHLFISAEEALLSMDQHHLLIVVDTNRPSMVENPELLNQAYQIVLIDHHRKHPEFIDNTVLSYHEIAASSACELVSDLIFYLRRNVELTELEADGLLAGITLDTKNFRVKAGTKTFEAAAFLERKGADTQRVRRLFKTKLENMRAKYESISQTEIFMERIALCVSENLWSDPLITAAQLADELLNIENIEASFVFAKVENTIYVSARSLSINVQLILEKLGGGGNKHMAGLQLEGMENLEDAKRLLKNAIIEYLEEA